MSDGVHNSSPLRSSMTLSVTPRDIRYVKEHRRQGTRRKDWFPLGKWNFALIQALRSADFPEVNNKAVQSFRRTRYHESSRAVVKRHEKLKIKRKMLVLFLDVRLQVLQRRPDTLSIGDGGPSPPSIASLTIFGSTARIGKASKPRRPLCEQPSK